MRVLFAISIFSFCALAWAALAIARHVRRTTANPLRPAPQAMAVAATAPDSTPIPKPKRKLRTYTPQRHGQTYAHSDSGNLQDPGARTQTRPRRKS